MKILITGVSSGIGRAMAKKFVNHGHLVWGIARSQEKLINLKNSLNAGRFLFSVCDVSSQNQVTVVFEEMNRNNFLPDVVILNAGIFPNDFEPKFNRQIFNDTFAVDFFGAINFIEFFLEKFIQRGFGHFIAMGSTAVFRPSNQGIAYPAAKAALSSAIKGFDLAYRKKGIIFSNVYLGPVATDMWEGKNNFLVSTPEKAAIFVSQLLRNKRRESYFPFLSTFILRLTKFIPNDLFSKLSNLLLK